MANLIRTLEKTMGRRVRRALDQIAGKPTGNYHPSRNQHSKTCKLNYAGDDLNFDDERDQWVRAIIQYRREHGRNPDLVEAFRLAKSLGYRREPSQ